MPSARRASSGLSLRAHPISFLRESLARRGAVECVRLAGVRTAMVGGLVLCRQRPATASGIVFMTLEDETGVANLIIRPRTWERCRRVGRHAGAILAEGHHPPHQEVGDAVAMLHPAFGEERAGVAADPAAALPGARADDEVGHAGLV
ncbi:MAG: error-prone DNA polymerase, partial [Phycisphaerales bacterium]